MCGVLCLFLSACASKLPVQTVTMEIKTTVDTSYYITTRNGYECRVRHAAPAVGDTVSCVWSSR